MSSPTNTSLTDQQHFWNAWNATLRDPKNLNDWSLKRGETIIELVRSLAIEHPKILDFGCGTGWLTERLAEFGDPTGVDLADRVIEAAQSRAPHIKFIAGDIFRIPLQSASYDIVVSQEVIAHIPHQAGYLDRVSEVLKSRGYLIITTPNKFVMDRSDWPAQPPEHIEHWLTMANLKRLLDRHFRILHTSTVVPLGNRGILRVINSDKMNAALRLFISQRNLEKLKERAGWGYTLVALAQKRS
ncbi:MAG TPA: class I SAM-dependent methyltransferase [Chthoniobacterales bacterium]|nr:class I SAM-dependent methyltransferase [Chthoniobacterales bacterium]